MSKNGSKSRRRIAGLLEFQQGVLPGVDVDRVNPAGTVQRVVEGIAARRRDHDDRVVRPEAERRAIEARVFPTGVVDEVVAVNPGETPLAEWHVGHAQTS